ncbi:GlsB/YeaQ/YmgE family stress response membrane protein [Tundrisphaera lichenicola]|uniref:GlsB/YeaQ/YmgE family stress response membrane protein n=1 Tax=Tundrisphaera lichenicola TaxID=2029860 RepID=UPI003EB75810
MIGSLIGWIILGLVAGFLARMLHPGNDSMGILPTIVLGVLGSLLGGGVAYLLQLGTSPYQPGGWILATIGAIVLLAFGWFGTRTRTAV